MAVNHVPSNHAAKLSDFGYKQELDRTLSVKDLVIYGLIFMVPIAPMGIYGSVISASRGMIALTYAIGMVAMFFHSLELRSIITSLSNRRLRLCLCQTWHQ